MCEIVDSVSRIVVVARPALGRQIEQILRGDGYEVHRTPGGGDFRNVIARLRPHLVIAALDIPWNDPVDIVQATREASRAVPTLLLGEPDPRFDGHFRLPLTIAAAHLLAVVRRLLADVDASPAEHEAATRPAQED